MSRSGSGRPRHRSTDALGTFLLYLGDIDLAVLDRDAMRITALLRKRIATHLPREVREELLAFSRAPRASFRAPVQFLRFQHRMTQLARGGERLLTAQRELPWNEATPADAPARSDAARRRDGERRSAASNPADERGMSETPRTTDSPSRRQDS